MKDFKIKNKETYPQIYTPIYLSDISNIIVQFEEIHPNFKKPIYQPKHRGKKEEGNLILGSLGCGFFVFFGITMIAVFISDVILNNTLETWRTYWLPSILFTTILITIIFAHLGIKGDSIEKEKKKEEKLKELEIYNIKLENYNKLLNKVNDPVFQKSEKIKRLENRISEVKKEIFKDLIILEDNAVKKGLSEEFYYTFLKSRSDFTVYKSVKFHYYYPDLIILKNDIMVVLEIDEPYILDTKEPIHYDSTDNSRNEFFSNYGFITIRFSEDQIISNPSICLEIINQVIESCISLTRFKKSQSFIEIETKAWSYEEAFNMAYNNQRKSIFDRINKLRVKYHLNY